MRSIAGILAAVCLMARAANGQIEMKPFPMEWRGKAGALVDLSHLLSAPAGKDGFVRVQNGHLATADGKRLRIWGVNFTAAATVPSKADAPEVAAHLARFGINCVRFHFLDRIAPNGLIDAKRDDTRALDSAQLDRFDFFVAELKKRGIYTNLNLNVARTYKQGDGVKDSELIGFGKALTYFDDRLLELQREYARQLLTHFNAYTGAEYRHEPAVAIVELVNENSIVESWFSNRLLGKNTRKNPGTWTDIPASYERDLTRKYHEWLAKRGLPAEPRLTRDQFASAPAERFRRESEFYMDLEDSFYQSMQKFLKNELGVRSLLVATSDHNHGNTGYPLLRSAAKLDVVDGHVYWQHPRYINDPVTGQQTGFEITNTPMVDDPRNSTVVQLSRSAVAAKPYTVSEVNHPFPNEYAAEGIPILAAYAALHDWDGLFWYTFEHKPASEWKPVQPRHFEIRPDPVKMTGIAAGALLFLRGDVKPAARTILRSYSQEAIAESIRLPRNEGPYFTPGFPLSLPLRHSVRIEGFDGPVTREFPADEEGVYASDTRQLSWRKGFVTTDTPRWQALIGRCNINAGADATNLSMKIENDFCAVTLTSLGSRSIARASNLLLTAGARVENTGMKWNEKRTSVVDWGTEPTVMEPVRGTVLLKGISGAKSIRAVALDSTALPIGKPVAARKTEDGWEIPIGETTTPWYLIRVKR